MNKIGKALFSLFVFIGTTSFALAGQVEKIAVFPVDAPVQGSTLSIYPETLNLISADIVNSLSKQTNLSVIDINSAENMVKAQGLSKKYQKFIREYKNTYVLDYDACSEIAGKLGASRLLLVSGGFDLQNLMMKRSWLYKLDIPGGRPLVPTYRLDIILTLIDPQTGVVIWENTYKKNFELANFAVPAQYFGENVVPVEQLKSFSHTFADKVAVKISEIFTKSESTQVNSRVISTNNGYVGNVFSTDGAMTTDGHLFSTGDPTLENRKTKYKNWVKNNQ